MNERELMAYVISDAHSRNQDIVSGDTTSEQYCRIGDEVVEALPHFGWQKAHVVDSIVELNGLMPDTVVRDFRGLVFERWDVGRGDRNPWARAGVGEIYNDAPTLPAKVLYSPGVTS